MHLSEVESTVWGGQNALKFCRLLKFILFPGSATTSISCIVVTFFLVKWSYCPFSFPTSSFTKVAERSAGSGQKVKITVRRVQCTWNSTWLLCAIFWLPFWLFLPYPKETSVSLTSQALWRMKIAAQSSCLALLETQPLQSGKPILNLLIEPHIFGTRPGSAYLIPHEKFIYLFETFLLTIDVAL